jgi:two-component system, NarL family, response regulator
MLSSLIKILVVEDHAIVREGLVAILNQTEDMMVVAEAENGESAIALYRQHQPDIALIDLRLPKIEGLQVISQVRTEFPNACLIILTTYDTDEDIYQGLQAGARGYILKGATSEELRNAIRTVHRGRKYIPPDVAIKLTERLNCSELTSRELEILQLLASGKCNADIATNLMITEGTVKFHVNKILSKLDVRDRTQAVITALRRGLVRLK